MRELSFQQDQVFWILSGQIKVYKIQTPGQFHLFKCNFIFYIFRQHEQAPSGYKAYQQTFPVCPCLKDQSFCLL